MFFDLWRGVGDIQKLQSSETGEGHFDCCLDKAEWSLESGVELNSLVEVVGHFLHQLENTFTETNSIFDGDRCIFLHHDLLRAEDVCEEVGNHGLTASEEFVAQEPHELS